MQKLSSINNIVTSNAALFGNQKRLAVSFKLGNLELINELDSVENTGEHENDSDE